MGRKKSLDLPQVPWQHNPFRPKKSIKVGEVVIIHGLTKRRDLNGKRGAILGQANAHAEGKEIRWKVKPVFQDNFVAVKPGNLKLPDYPPYKTIPSYLEFATWQMRHCRNLKALHEGKPHRVKGRGVTYPNDPIDEQARKLVEYLDCCHGMTLNKTVLLGTVGRYYGFIAENSMRPSFTMEGIEHATAIATLADKCQRERYEVGTSSGEKEYSGWIEATMYALLEGYPHSIQAIFGMIACTPYIGPEEEEPSSFKYVEDCQTINTELTTWKLTPPQTHKDYITAMMVCYLILKSIAQVKKRTEIGEVFFRTIEKHPLFSLFLERSFIIVAREIMGTPDGKVLGPEVRTVLAHLASLTESTDSTTLRLFGNTDEFPKHPDYVRGFLNKPGVTSYEELHEFLDTLVGPCECCRNKLCVDQNCG